MAGDLVILVAVSALAITLHVVLFMVFRRWMGRDLALSFAGDDPGKREYMLGCLARARREGVGRRDLPGWLERAAAARPGSRGAT